jgi:hypothetical protein
VLLLVSLTEERAIYLAFELDRSWTEMTGVNPLDGCGPSIRVKSHSLRDNRPARRHQGVDQVYLDPGNGLLCQIS